MFILFRLDFNQGYIIQCQKCSVFVMIIDLILPVIVKNMKKKIKDERVCSYCIPLHIDITKSSYHLLKNSRNKSNKSKFLSMRYKVVSLIFDIIYYMEKNV
ncbi:hypothetical protein V1478_015380 [Vespula squamosa]|uniref:Uncharacterized protein n=1 Tax=Vespula squamosa TaxID=30214 RepID=A0ABD2A4X8_VESSQ